MVVTLFLYVCTCLLLTPVPMVDVGNPDMFIALCPNTVLWPSRSGGASRQEVGGTGERRGTAPFQNHGNALFNAGEQLFIYA